MRGATPPPALALDSPCALPRHDSGSWAANAVILGWIGCSPRMPAVDVFSQHGPVIPDMFSTPQIPAAGFAFPLQHGRVGVGQRPAAGRPPVKNATEAACRPYAQGRRSAAARRPQAGAMPAHSAEKARRRSTGPIDRCVAKPAATKAAATKPGQTALALHEGRLAPCREIAARGGSQNLRQLKPPTALALQTCAR